MTDPKFRPWNAVSTAMAPAQFVGESVRVAAERIQRGGLDAVGEPIAAGFKPAGSPRTG